MASTPPISIKPVAMAKETLVGMTIGLEQRFGITPRNDLGTTLNSRFGVLNTRKPANPVVEAFFCWGVGGRVSDTDNLVSPQFVLGTNMAPYAIRPFRAMLLAQDLTDDERKQYGMRVVKDIAGQRYVLYYLKRITFGSDQVQYIRTDPGSGIVTDYTLDYSNLNPVPPVVGDNGVITDVADAISVVLPGTLTITGQEAFESASVIDGGDMRYAAPSEFGFVSASIESVPGEAANGQVISYDEAICAQMTDHYTWGGYSFVSTADDFERTFQFSIRNMVNQG
jgi:hypothetical protein